MARRRALEDGDTGEMMADDLGSLIGGDKPPIADPGDPFKGDPFGGKVPKGPQDIGPDPDTESGPVGSRERPMEMRPTSQTPTSFGPRLPQGVTVDDGMFSGVPEFGNAMNAPGQSMTPRPTSGNLSFAPPEGGTSRGPQRRSASSSVLYAQPNSPTLSGRAGGLMEGGMGATGGSDQMGPLTPTELMQRLLQMYRGG